MGMPEYRDGSFGAIRPVEEALALLTENPDEQERTRALHIGTFEELVKRPMEIVKPVKPTTDQEVTEQIAAILARDGVASALEQLRMDVNKIMIQLGIDDKKQVLRVDRMPQSNNKGEK